MSLGVCISYRRCYHRFWPKRSAIYHREYDKIWTSLRSVILASADAIDPMQSVFLLDVLTRIATTCIKGLCVHKMLHNFTGETSGAHMNVQLCGMCTALFA